MTKQELNNLHDMLSSSNIVTRQLAFTVAEGYGLTARDLIKLLWCYKKVKFEYKCLIIRHHHTLHLGNYRLEQFKSEWYALSLMECCFASKTSINNIINSLIERLL